MAQFCLMFGFIGLQDITYKDINRAQEFDLYMFILVLDFYSDTNLLTQCNHTKLNE